jgi:metallo-beta-lactamase class B
MKLTLLALTFLLADGLIADPPHECDPCEEWNKPSEPFRVYGNTWYVGTAGLGSILIVSDRGHVLIDGGLPQSAPLIADNIRKAGFRLTDVKLILNSHTHYDHAGGIAALQRASGAALAASPAARRALEHGGPREDDPQFAFGEKHNNYAAVRNVREIADGESVKVGPLSVKAVFTPGHTAGGTSWTWESCDQGKCLRMVYADSLNAVSAPEFRFTGSPRLAELERSIARVAALPCDILLVPHPQLIDMAARLPDLRDPTACERYSAGARQRLQTRLDEEKAQR